MLRTHHFFRDFTFRHMMDTKFFTTNPAPKRTFRAGLLTTISTRPDQRLRHLLAAAGTLNRTGRAIHLMADFTARDVVSRHGFAAAFTHSGALPAIVFATDETTEQVTRTVPLAAKVADLAAFRAHPLTAFKTDRHAAVLAYRFAAFGTLYQTRFTGRMQTGFAHANMFYFLVARLTTGQHNFA